MAELVARIEVDAPVEQTWAAVTDWDRQGEWMLATTVRAGRRDGEANLVAATGWRRLAVRDPMVITAWEPPQRCEVRHTGRLVRGSGAFEVRPLADGRSEFVWSEWLELPWGMAGELGWWALRPVLAAGVQASLRRFARWAPTYRRLDEPGQR